MDAADDGGGSAMGGLAGVFGGSLGGDGDGGEGGRAKHAGRDGLELGRLNSSEEATRNSNGSAAEEEEDAKRQRTAGTGGNQREVQRRYRERKKERTKELEQRVATLQARLHDLESGAGVSGGGSKDSRDSEMSTCEGVEANEENMMHAFRDGTERLQTLVERGASDSELRTALNKMCGNMACSRQLTPESNFGRAMMHKHAALLNDVKEGGGTPGLDVCTSVCGGYLKANASVKEGTDKPLWLGDAEAKAHWSSVVDRFEPLMPPCDMVKLLEWRNEYVSGISAIYKRRQQLGAQLAFTGRSVDQDDFGAGTLQLSSAPPGLAPTTALIQGYHMGNQVVATDASAHAGALATPRVAADAGRRGGGGTGLIESFTHQQRVSSAHQTPNPKP
jgi:hypothetical protein